MTEAAGTGIFDVAALAAALEALEALEQEQKLIQVHV